MHVLVTGSAGRVGRRVVALLRARGDTVTGFDLRPLGRDDVGYREVVGTFEDAAAAARAIDGADAVLHLGAFMSWLPQDAARVYAANATATFHLLAAGAEVRARHTPVDEMHPREPISTYGLSKLVAEDMVAFFHRKQGLPFVILRFAHTQDASEPLDDGAEKHLVQCGEDGIPYRMMIADARDIADGVLLALDAPGAHNATMNLGPDQPISFDDAVAALQAATGLGVVQARLPGPPVKYATSNALARELLGFRPRWTFAAMVADAASARRS